MWIAANVKLCGVLLETGVVCRQKPLPEQGWNHCCGAQLCRDLKRGCARMGNHFLRPASCTNGRERSKNGTSAQFDLADFAADGLGHFRQEFYLADSLYSVRRALQKSRISFSGARKGIFSAQA